MKKFYALMTGAGNLISLNQSPVDKYATGQNSQYTTQDKDQALEAAARYATKTGSPAYLLESISETKTTTPPVVVTPITK